MLPSIEMTLADVARLVGGTVRGDGAAVIRGVAGLEDAVPGSLTFLANARYRRQLASTRATAVLIGPADAPAEDDRLADNLPSLVVVDEPSLAFSQLIERFSPAPPRPDPGVHPTAVVSDGATVGDEVSIGACVVVEAGATIGRRSVLYPGVYVGHGSTLGQEVVLHANVVVQYGSVLGDRVVVHPGAVIGSDGFGYVLIGPRAIKVPQQGTVELGDDVEIGANTTIDRARFDRTRIGAGSKLDNLCQIGHNVVIGSSTYMAAQAGVAGSASIGNGVMVGGQSGIAGHLTIADGARIAAQAGVSRDMTPGMRVCGYPAMPTRQFWRMIAHAKRLGELTARVAELTKRIEELEGNPEDD